MPVGVYVSFVLASMLFGLMPGPSVCFTIAHAIRHGSPRTAPTILGQATANALQLLVVVLGMGSVLQRSVVTLEAIRLVGAAYLVYLGLRGFFANQPPPLSEDLPVAKGWVRAFVNGFVVCGTNPKAFLYYSAILPQFMIPELGAGSQLLILGTSSVFVAILVLAGYALAAGQARCWLVDKGLWQAQARVSGALIVAAGATLALARSR